MLPLAAGKVALDILLDRRVLIGAAVVAAIGYVAWQRHSLATARAERDAALASVSDLQRVNAENVAEIGRIRAAEAAARQAINDVAKASADRARQSDKLKRRIDDASRTDQSGCRDAGGPIRAAIDGLRSRAAGGPDQNGTTGAAR